MKIATYNMQHNKNGISNWSKMLDEVDPDIFLVQESLAPPEYRLPLLEEDWTTTTVWAPTDSGWGSGIFVKAEAPRTLSLPEFSGWVVGVELADMNSPSDQAGGRSLRVFSVHAPKEQSYQRAVNQILDMIEDYRGDGDVVIGGDFNLTISKRHESEERQTEKDDLAIQVRLQEFGLTNCWQAANPDSPLVQTLRWGPNPEPPYHCDGIFVPESWAERLSICDVLSGSEWDKISDHNPVVAEFD